MVVVTAAGTTMFTDLARSWAVTLETLDAGGAETLVRMCRLLYPHDQLGDMYYATVVEALDGEAGSSEDTHKLLTGGIAALDAARGIPFTDLSEGTQTEVLEEMQDAPFFQKVRGAVVYHLYNNPLVWRHFGYEGASYEQGGYILRGFQDAGWLETPPEDVSPPAYQG
ncbi:MAG: gluconate 2-dehydrogenase subunit 3 family protein [Geminicoccaceae bacterium]